MGSLIKTRKKPRWNPQSKDRPHMNNNESLISAIWIHAPYKIIMTISNTEVEALQFHINHMILSCQWNPQLTFKHVFYSESVTAEVKLICDLEHTSKTPWGSFCIWFFSTGTQPSKNASTESMISLSDSLSSFSSSLAVAAKSASCLAARRNSSKKGESTLS